MANYLKKNTQAITQLLELISKISGQKILMLACKEKVFEVDVNEDGYFGYEDSHKPYFLAKIAMALEEGGALIIREFLNVRTKKTLSSGKELWIPEKNLYGVVLTQGMWMGLSAESLQDFYRTDAKSGEILPREEGVHYRSLEMESSKEESLYF